MGGAGLAGAAGGVLAAEVCAPILLMCWLLCCWPDDASSDTSSTGKHPKKPVVKCASTGQRRRVSETSSARGGSSIVSLQLPSTSGHRRYGGGVSAHRSHEEIRSSRRSQRASTDEGERYHSAPSVIDEVLQRRHWERSSKDLRDETQGGYVVVKLRSQSDESLASESRQSPQPETSSTEDILDQSSSRTCKKHHKNTKNYRQKIKEGREDDIKDLDVTETILKAEKTSFYIGDDEGHPYGRGEGVDGRRGYQGTSSHDEMIGRNSNDSRKSLYKAKDAKQSFNESVRSARQVEVAVVEDRSGAMHRKDSITGCSSQGTIISVEPVGYEGGVCYLSESGAAAAAAAEGGRGRHASDGDILAPAKRPESGAFSESELELELRVLCASDDRPPPYCELEESRAMCGKETAI